MDSISANEVKYKKKIGMLNDMPVFEIGLIGGLHLIVTPTKGTSKVETLGAGSHRAVARHLAKQMHPTLEITELAKGDHLELSVFAHQLPRFEALVHQLNAISRKK